MATKLTSVPSLSKYADLLSRLGYDSAEEVYGAAQVAGHELAKYLGIDSIAQLMIASASAAPEAVTHNFALGVLLDRVPRLAFAAPMAAESLAQLPSHVSLIKQMTAIRDQGGRGTCVAFATIAAFEHYLKGNKRTDNMSEQFLYWNCKRNDGIPNSDGTWVGVAAPLVHRDGACTEKKWAYNAVFNPSNVGQGPPPAGAVIEALGFRSPVSTQLAPTDVHAIKAALAKKKPVAFSIPVFNSWYGSRAVRLSGNITMPIPGEAIIGGHAMCFVGYKDDPTAPGGGRLYLRNSWGTAWASASALDGPTPGYGTIPYAYIANYGSEAYCVE